MQILSLDNGNFLAYSMPHGKFDMVFKTPQGTYKQLQAQTMQELDNCIRIWTYYKYIAKVI